MERLQRWTNKKDGFLNIFGQGACIFPNYRRVFVFLGLLNATLLMIAVGLGVKCAKVKEGSFHVTHSAASQLIEKIDFLRSNHSDVVEAEEESKRELTRVIQNHAQLKEQIEQQKVINGECWKKIEALQVEKTILQSNISVLEGSCGRCLPGWILLNSSCYFFSYTESSTVKKNWPDSRQDCIRRGSDLIVIDNQEEQKFASNSIQNKKTTSDKWYNGFWIGLSDREIEGTWVWNNNVEEVELRYRTLSMFYVDPDRRIRLAAASLMGLASVLLIVDISLGVHYNKLTGTYLTPDDIDLISKDLAQLQDTYKTSVKNMNDAQKQVDKEMSLQIETKWELEHHTKSSNDYDVQFEKATNDVNAMKAYLPMIGAKAKDFQIPLSADAGLIAEVNHFRNQSDIIRAKMEAQSALAKERANHLQMKLQIKQKKMVLDILQGKIEKLQTEKASLQSNKTGLERSKMEDRENSAGPYNKLIYQEESGADEQPLYSNQEKQHVSLTTVRPTSSFNHYKLLTLSLAALAAFLLAVDIGLGVYYYNLTDGSLIRDLAGEVAKLQVSYNAAVKSREDAKEQLAREIGEQAVTKWELEHHTRRNKDYENKMEKFQMEISTLKSHIPMIKEGCRHCSPGWTFVYSVCYFFPFDNTYSLVNWQQAREYCKRKGGDLAVIDSREKHLAVTNLINNYKDPMRTVYQSGFWIGLRDIEEEGTWKWLDGTRLNEGYWNDGEPNNQNNEDCAAVYPRSNPFKAWNDAPCNHNLKWICEKQPWSIG
ncbi:uncharacterized protein FYW49_010784 [Xenentodon cancila]